MLPATAIAAPQETHRIEQGDTLSEVAASYGVTVRDLASANGLADVNRIYAGRTLIMPGAPTASASATASGSTHGVAPGETLSGIASSYGVSSSALAEANNLTNPHRIIAGMRLKLPQGASGSTSSGSAGTGETIVHTVSAGQTLSGIAARYRVPAAAIATHNGLHDRDVIVAGTALSIPVTGRPSADTASRDTVERLIEDAAARHGWDPNLIKAISWQESGWNNKAVSSVGAVGIMQVLPSTNRDVSEPRAGRMLDLADPADNIEAGLQFLGLLHDLTDGDAERILAGYYQGLRSVRENGRYPSTERYIANIMALWERFERSG